MGDQSVSKPTQELIITGNELPEKYIVHKGKTSDEIIDSSSLQEIKIPVIDVGRLMSPSLAGEEVEKLQSAHSSCGCFQLINFGMTSSYLHKVHQVGKNFFALSKEEKQKYSRSVDDIEGYGSDSLFPNYQTHDWMDRLSLTINPHHKRNLNLWPQNPPSFREVLDDYTKNLETIFVILLKAMSKSLNLEENSFLKQYGKLDEATVLARFNYYPPCPRPDLVLGTKPHNDTSAITFLLQDQVEGLQVLINGQWFRVPNNPNALLINVGDQFEIMSNGAFKSPVHRVVANSERERMTVAVFFFPNSEQEMEPLEELVNENSQPRLYKKVKNYPGMYFHNYHPQERPIHLLML